MVWDTQSTLTLFNFLRPLDQSQPHRQVPSHRRFEPIQCIDVSDRNVISCSLDRDLRMWDRTKGTFCKKYDLSSFTAEAVSTIKHYGAGMLFLGSKDMNVYLIDVLKGKLCVVYEGHWSRVTALYSIPNKDILITISESNIKVWDLEFDECIKNMNEHTSLIVYCKLAKHSEEQMVTISQNYEFKQWNYTSGAVLKSFKLNLPPSTQLVACDMNADGVVFCALENNFICVYSLEGQCCLTEFESHNNEDVIHIEHRETVKSDYLVVATRTSCILYLIQEDVVKRMCAYFLNARKMQQGNAGSKARFSYSSRYYFTAVKLECATESLCTVSED